MEYFSYLEIFLYGYLAIFAFEVFLDLVIMKYFKRERRYGLCFHMPSRYANVLFGISIGKEAHSFVGFAFGKYAVVKIGFAFGKYTSSFMGIAIGKDASVVIGFAFGKKVYSAFGLSIGKEKFKVMECIRDFNMLRITSKDISIFFIFNIKYKDTIDLFKYYSIGEKVA